MTFLLRLWADPAKRKKTFWTLVAVFFLVWVIWNQWVGLNRDICYNERLHYELTDTSDAKRQYENCVQLHDHFLKTWFAR